jgi:uncharacterized protein YjbI with pentapeptide repeats
MSSPSHAEILRRGPLAWNAWRAQNPSERPHLARVTLKLSERQWGPMHGGPINLKSAILPDASLRFASLLDADLQAADLTRADLIHARLNRANLKNAILKDAVLDHADFADAYLGKAVVTGASLSHARNLTQNQIDETIGDASTTLPAHLARPAAWVDVATPLSQPSSISHRKVLISCLAASMMAGAILLGFEKEYWEPASSIGPDQVEKPVALASPDDPANSATSSNADPAGSKPNQEIFDSLSKSVTAPPPQQNVPENSVVRLMPPEGTPAIGLSAPSTANPTIDSSIRIDGVLGLSGPAQAATARVEIEPFHAALPSPESNDQAANTTIVETAPPLPDRNPIVASVTSKSKMAAAANTTIVETTPPIPERNPIFASTTVKASSAEAEQSANEKRALVRPPTQPKTAIPDHVKPGQKTARRPEVVQPPIYVKPKNSTADVLAGGL